MQCQDFLWVAVAMWGWPMTLVLFYTEQWLCIQMNKAVERCLGQQGPSGALCGRVAQAVCWSDWCALWKLCVMREVCDWSLAMQIHPCLIRISPNDCMGSHRFGFLLKLFIWDLSIYTYFPEETASITSFKQLPRIYATHNSCCLQEPSFC